MLNVFLLLARVGEGRYDALQMDLDTTRSELAAAASDRTSLKNALATATAPWTGTERRPRHIGMYHVNMASPS